MHHLLKVTSLKKLFQQFKQNNGLLKEEKPTSAFNCRKCALLYAKYTLRRSAKEMSLKNCSPYIPRRTFHAGECSRLVQKVAKIKPAAADAVARK